MGINSCSFIGNLGRTPEVRSTPSGEKVANFNIAVSERYTDKSGQKQESTEWVKCVLWKGLAEIAERYLQKGSQVFIQGKMKTRSYDDKNGGAKRYATEIIVKDLQMLGSKGETQSQEPQQNNQQDSAVNNFDNAMPPQRNEFELPFE